MLAHVKIEADKFQCLFIIAYLYFRKKLNFPTALDYFERSKAQGMGKQEHKQTFARSFIITDSRDKSQRCNCSRDANSLPLLSNLAFSRPPPKAAAGG